MLLKMVVIGAEINLSDFIVKHLGKSIINVKNANP